MGSSVPVAAALPAILAALQDDFERAAEAAGGSVDLNLTIAERPVCIRFAGEVVAEALTPALGHLEAARPETAAFTLHVWDFATAHAARPAFAPARSADAGSSGAGPSYYWEGEGFRALHQPSSDVLSVLSNQAVRGWFWMPDARALPYWDYSAPFRHLLSWWLDAQGMRQIHGGAVGTAEAGVLLVGPGGSGKSTTALASLLDDRLRYAGDDYVGVAADDVPFVHSLYCSAKVHRDDLHRLPHLVPALTDTVRPDEKAVFYVERAFPGRAIARFPLRAIVVPRVTDRDSARARPTTGAAALAAIAPSTIFQLHPPAREALSHMAELVRKLPSFFLELGTDVETVPAELLRLLDRVG